MKYVLRSCYLENTHEEQIDADRFNRIKHARRVLIAAFELEDIFDNLISNYLEVEGRCLTFTADRLVRKAVGYREGNEGLAAINLVFVNHLTTARAYVDKIGRTASRCFNEPDSAQVATTVKTLLAEQFDASFGFRFIEALRNHVQHSGRALHVLRQGSRRIKIDDQSGVESESFLEPLCKKSDLVESGNFKTKVLAECPEVVNLLECTRLHLRGLSRVHRAVRTMTAKATVDAAAQMKEGQTSLVGKVTGSLDGTEAVSVKPDGEVGETIPMILHWEDVRTWLVQRNPGALDSAQTYPSGWVAP